MKRLVDGLVAGRLLLLPGVPEGSHHPLRLPLCRWAPWPLGLLRRWAPWPLGWGLLRCRRAPGRWA